MGKQTNRRKDFYQISKRFLLLSVVSSLEDEARHCSEEIIASLGRSLTRTARYGGSKELVGCAVNGDVNGTMFLCLTAGRQRAACPTNYESIETSISCSIASLK